MSKNVGHSSEKTPRELKEKFIVLFAINCTNPIKSNYLNFHGEEAQEKPHRAYKFHTYVISAHFFGQVQVFFFFTHCIVIKVRLESTGC